MAAIGMAIIAISHALSYMVILFIILAGIRGYTYMYVICTTGDRTDQVRLLCAYNMH